MLAITTLFGASVVGYLKETKGGRMIKYLFLDLDDTILDFKKAEAIAIRKTMAAYGLEPTDALAARYSEVNERHWKALERGELSRDQVVTTDSPFSSGSRASRWMPPPWRRPTKASSPRGIGSFPVRKRP